MTTINADVAHLWTTKAAFPTLSPGSKYKTTAYDSTLKLLMMKDDNSDTIASEWSDDTLQCLLAGAQTVSGVKTFSNGLKLAASQKIGVTGTDGLGFDASDNATFSKAVSLAEILTLTPKEVATITDGVTNLDPSDTSHIMITKDNSAPGSNDCGISAGTFDGQLLLITLRGNSTLRIDPTVSSSAGIQLRSGATGYNTLTLYIGNNALFIWRATGGAYTQTWDLVSTTGVLG